MVQHLRYVVTEKNATEIFDTEEQTDRRTDGQTDTQGFNGKPPSFSERGYNYQ